MTCLRITRQIDGSGLRTTGWEPQLYRDMNRPTSSLTNAAIASFAQSLKRSTHQHSAHLTVYRLQIMSIDRTFVCDCVCIFLFMRIIRYNSLAVYNYIRTLLESVIIGAHAWISGSFSYTMTSDSSHLRVGRTPINAGDWRGEYKRAPDVVFNRLRVTSAA